MSEPTKDHSASGEALSGAGTDRFTGTTSEQLLGKVVHDLRSLTDVDDILSRIALAIGETGLYRRAVLTLHNPQGDITAIGYHGLPKEIITAARHAPRVPLADREAILNTKNKISASYFIPTELGIDLAGEGRHVEGDVPSPPKNEWQPEDELFVPLHNTAGQTIGYASVDTPPDGKRPTLPTVQKLELLIDLATQATERVHLTQELTQLESRFQRVLSNCTDVIFRANVVDNSFDYISPNIEKLTGYTAEHVMSQPMDALIAQIVSPEDRSRMLAAWGARRSFSNADTLNSPAMELKILHQDGSERQVIEKSTSFADEDGRIIAIEGVLRDVTEERLLRETLTQAELRFHVLAENTSDLIYTRDTTGVFTYLSPAAQRYLGVAAQEAIGTSLALWLTDNQINQAAYEVFCAEIDRGEKLSPLVLEIRARNGSTFLMEFEESLIIDAAGKALGVQGRGRDVTEHKQTAHALKQSEEQLQNFFANTTIGVYRTTPEGQILMANPALMRMLGFASFAELAGRNLEQAGYEPGYDRAAFKKRLENEGSFAGLETAWTRRDGSTLFVRESARAVGDDTGKIIYYEGTVEDISQRRQAEEELRRAHDQLEDGVRERTTELRRANDDYRQELTQRRQAEQALRESERKFRELANLLPQTIFEIDLDGKVIFANQFALEFFGYSSRELKQGLNAFELFVAADHEKIRQNIQRLLDGEKLTGHEYTAVRKDGHHFSVAIHSSVIFHDKQPSGFRGIIYDLTERKRAEKTLRESEAGLKRVQHLSQIGSWEWDLKDNSFRISDEMGRIYGIPGNNHFADYRSLIETTIHPDDKEAVLQAAQEAAIDFVGQPMTYRIVRPDGEIRWVMATRPEIQRRGPMGEVESMIGAVQDVTERQQLLRKVRRKGKELDRANKVLGEMVHELRQKNKRARELSADYRAKNTELQSLVSMLSHDLKTPLVSIRELAALFRRRYARLVDEGGQDLARRISSNAKNMLRLIDSLLDYSRAEEFVNFVEEVDLARLVSDLWEQILDAFPERKSVIHLPSTVVRCPVSRPALERVLANLLNNAVTYVPADRQPIIKVDWSLAENVLTTRVTDNGCGIASEEQDKIFELFYRASGTAVEGSGIGLAIVKRVVDAAGGTITVESPVQGGTTFVVTLPLSN